jgi:hypothetical protein
MSVLLMTIQRRPTTSRKGTMPKSAMLPWPAVYRQPQGLHATPTMLLESLDLTSSAILLVSMQAVRTVTEVAFFDILPHCVRNNRVAKCCQYISADADQGEFADRMLGRPLDWARPWNKLSGHGWLCQTASIFDPTGKLKQRAQLAVHGGGTVR